MKISKLDEALYKTLGSIIAVAFSSVIVVALLWLLFVVVKGFLNTLGVLI